MPSQDQISLFLKHRAGEPATGTGVNYITSARLGHPSWPIHVPIQVKDGLRPGPGYP